MEKHLITKEKLARDSDVGESTIGLYLKKGLIPKPLVVSNHNGRKGRTGLYNSACIERIKRIKELTGEPHYYTLEAIKEIFDREEKVSNMPLQIKIAKYAASLLKAVGKYEYSDKERELIGTSAQLATGGTGNTAQYLLQNLEALKEIKKKKEGK